MDERDLVGELDRTGPGHTTGVVAAQVDQHEVLRQLLGISQQLLLQDPILLLGMAATAGAGYGTHRHLAFLQPDQDLR